MNRYFGAALMLACLVGPISARAQAIHDQVTAAAAAAGVPVHIAHAVVRHESGYRARAYNRGAMGLGQILCRTARGIGFSGPCSALYDPGTNLRWSMKYLAMALAKGGAGCSGISLYQTGLGRRPHCSAYGRAVMARTGRGTVVAAGAETRPSSRLRAGKRRSAAAKPPAPEMGLFGFDGTRFPE